MKEDATLPPYKYHIPSSILYAECTDYGLAFVWANILYFNVGLICWPIYSLIKEVMCISLLSFLFVFFSFFFFDKMYAYFLFFPVKPFRFNFLLELQFLFFFLTQEHFQFWVLAVESLVGQFFTISGFCRSQVTVELVGPTSPIQFLKPMGATQVWKLIKYVQYLKHHKPSTSNSIYPTHQKIKWLLIY